MHNPSRLVQTRTSDAEDSAARLIFSVFARRLDEMPCSLVNDVFGLNRTRSVAMLKANKVGQRLSCFADLDTQCKGSRTSPQK
jgi:hypothetical protein